MLSSLKSHYNIIVHWKGANYCGLKLYWNYQKQYVDISIPGYVDKMLRQFQHIKKKEQHVSHEYAEPFYWKKIKHSSPPDKFQQLDSKGSKRVQSVCEFVCIMQERSIQLFYQLSTK